MLKDLWAHLTWADDTILKAVAGHEGAFADTEISQWLHHIVTVQLFFLAQMQSRPFDMQRFRQPPGDLPAMEQLYQEAHSEGAAFIAGLTDAELNRTFEFPVMKEFQPSVRDGLMQVAMHSEHHRAQCAHRLRALGGKPPVADYILWVRTVR